MSISPGRLPISYVREPPQTSQKSSYRTGFTSIFPRLSLFEFKTWTFHRNPRYRLRSGCATAILTMTVGLLSRLLCYAKPHSTAVAPAGDCLTWHLQMKFPAMHKFCKVAVVEWKVRWRTGKSSPTTSARPVGVAAVSQVGIPRADSFGLWRQSVRTADALLCVPMKSWLRLLNLNARC